MNVRYFLGLFLIVVVSSLAAQQRPFISGLNKTSATVGETLTINGSGFPTNTANIRVQLGTGQATVTTATSTQLTVTVPSTATYGPVTVTDLSSRLSGTSNQYFSLSFGGEGFDLTQLGDQLQFPTNSADRQQTYYDLCTCDFDGDGKMDVAVSNTEANNVAVFRNTSTLTTPSFSRTLINTGFSTIHTDCGDLNGDGKSDLVFSNNSGTNLTHLFVYRNTSAGPGNPTFTLDAGIRTPNQANGEVRNVRKVKLADIDGDGLLDLIVGTDAPDAILLVYRNTSSGNSITFASTPVEIAVPESTDTGILEVSDLNNDGLPDLAVVAFDDQDGIFLLRNQSSPGDIAFASPIALNDEDPRAEIMILDLDLDGLNDIITSSRINNRVEVFKNQGDFGFSSVSTITIPRPVGLAGGDLDGDRFPDITVSSAQAANQGTAALYLVRNISEEGTIDLETEITVPTVNSNRYVRVVDINGDAKPDFTFTHNITTGSFSDLSVILNQNCLEPEIFPGDLTFCVNNPFTLEATRTAGATYSWSVTSGNGSVTSSSDNEATFNITSGTSATIEVTITATDGSCTDIGSQTFTVTPGTPPSAPAITPSITGIVCAGEDFTLTGPTGFDTYYWVLPDGSEVTETDNILEISGAAAANAGAYELRVQNEGSCVGPAGTATVNVDVPPAVSIVNTGTDDFCATSSVTLEIPDYDGFSFQWKQDGTDVGTDQNSLTASTSGSYTVTVISDATGCENESDPIELTAVALPEPDIASVDEVCVNYGIDFSAAQSVNADGFAVTYTWDFADGSATTTGEEVAHTFTAPGDYDVVLTATYDDVDACEATFTKTITVADIPEIEIVASAMEKCPDDAVLLTLPEGFISYEWSANGEVISTTNTADAVTTDTQNEVTVSFSGVTAIGCPVTSEITISNFANSRIEVSSPDGTIVNDTITLETNLSTVILTAENGSEYEWSPASILDATTGATVKVYPPTQFTTVSVTGIDAINGCVTTRNIVIETPGIIPRKSFSPNGDGLGFDCWEILNTDNLEGCVVYIMDQRGRYVHKGESPFVDNCVWNGNIDNGSSQAPEGVYYFVMKCDNGDNNRTGTILLAR